MPRFFHAGRIGFCQSWGNKPDPLSGLHESWEIGEHPLERGRVLVMHVGERSHNEEQSLEITNHADSLLFFQII